MIIHSFLLIGQSNMAGRGYPADVEPLSNDNIAVLRNGRWWPRYVPVNPDRVTAGVNLAESFADRYEREKGVKVGLIPCADGGTNIDQWKVGGVLFDHACYMAELASRSSTIAGVLWHQGESDCADGRYQVYGEKLAIVMDTLRKRLGLHDVPFLLGGLGDFLTKFEPPHFDTYVKINEALKAYADSRAMTGFVSAEGLSANPDNLHFCAPALREFGVRYYEKFLELEDKSKLFPEKPSEFDVVSSGLEHL